MAKATTTITFANGDQVTSTKLNQIISGFSLGADSVDGSTITLNSGVLSLGVVVEANYGAASIPTAALKDSSVTAAKLAADAVETAKIKDLNVTGAKIAEETIAFTKTLTADRAVQADMQSQTAAHFISPDVLKYHPGVAKATGSVNMATGTIAGGYGVTGSASGTSTSRTITLSAAMANTNYTVAITAVNTSGLLSNAPVVTAKTTTTFTINSGGDAEMFAVFGQLA